MKKKENNYAFIDIRNKIKKAPQRRDFVGLTFPLVITVIIHKYE